MFKNDRRLNYGRNHIEKWAGGIETTEPTVLDIGAGEGLDLSIVRAQLGSSAKLIAVESWTPFVHHLQSTGVRVCDIDIERDELPLEDESVDMIIANQIFEHTKELFWIMHELTRVLKVGGKMIIGVPNLAALHNRILLSIGRQPTCIRADGAHVRAFTESGVKQITNVWDGYQMIERKGANFVPLPNALAKLAAEIFPALSTCIFLLFEKESPYHDENYLKYPRDQKLATNYFTGKHRTEFSQDR